MPRKSLNGVGRFAPSGFALSILCLILFAKPADALDPSSHVTQYAHTSWRVQDGTFRGSPTALAQTKDGYLWIGTLGGVYRFDGITLGLTGFSEKNQMRSPRVVSLLAAQDGSLWIGTGSEIEHWSGGQLTHYPESIGFISGIAESPKGSIWFSRDRTLDRSGALCRVEDLHTRCFGTSAGVTITRSGLLGLPQDRDGHLWFGDVHKLFQWDPASTHVISTLDIPSSGGTQEVAALQLDSAGNLIVGSQQTGQHTGLLSYDGKETRPFIASGADLANLSVTALLWDKKGSLWIGTDNSGLYRVVRGHAEHYRSVDGLSGESVNALYEDSEGNVWVATAGGLDRFRDLKVITYSSHEGLSADSVNAVIARKDGSVWLSNFHALDAIKDGAVTSISAGTGLPGSEVTAIFEDHLGVLWVGIDDTLFSYDRGRFTEVPIKDPDEPASVRSISEDRSGTLWVMNDNGRLFALRNGKVVRDLIDGTARFAVTPAMSPDANQGIWLITHTQDFAHVSEAGVVRIELHRPPNTANVYSMITLDDGDVLAGSAVGVTAVHGGRVQTLGVKGGLPCPHVWSLIQDLESAVWLYTECGLLVIEKKDWDHWWTNPAEQVRLRVVDALEGAQAANAWFTSTSSRSDSGDLWFANSGVVQSIRPSVLRSAPFSAPIKIEQVMADQAIYSSAAAVKLPPRPRNVQIDYAAPSFSMPSKVQFRYRLVGRDKSWVDAGLRRQAFYTDLGPGHYQFEVVASDTQGDWTGPAARLQLEIAPTFYQSAWFVAACILALVAFVWLLYLLRLRQLAARIQLRVEARLTERERIARDLHDTLLQGVQGLLFTFHAGIERLPRSEPTRVTLEEALLRADGLISEGRAQVMGLRSETNDPASLEDRLAGLIMNLAPAESAKVRLSTVGEARPVRKFASEQIARIAGEALQNATMHAACSQIKVELSYADAELVLRVVDDGRGFDSGGFSQRPPAGHFGLLGMSERAERLHATLEIRSRQSEGTRITLTVAAARAYDVDRISVWDRLSGLWQLPPDLE